MRFDKDASGVYIEIESYDEGGAVRDIMNVVYGLGNSVSEQLRRSSGEDVPDWEIRGDGVWLVINAISKHAVDHTDTWHHHQAVAMWPGIAALAIMKAA